MNKEKILLDNEVNYEKEAREKYGDDIVTASYLKIKGMSETDLLKVQELNEQIFRTLQAAFEQGDPASELAQKACGLHAKWLCLFWPENTYSKQAHYCLVESYLTDERFIAYYDKIKKGCTDFLVAAMKIYCQ